MLKRLSENSINDKLKDPSQNNLYKINQIRAYGEGAKALLLRLLKETQLTESLQKIAIVDPNNQLNMEDSSFISNSKYNKMKIMIRNYLSMLFCCILPSLDRGI